MGHLDLDDPPIARLSMGDTVHTGPQTVESRRGPTVQYSVRLHGLEALIHPANIFCEGAVMSSVRPSSAPAPSQED